MSYSEAEDKKLREKDILAKPSAYTNTGARAKESRWPSRYDEDKLKVSHEDFQREYSPLTTPERFT